MLPECSIHINQIKNTGNAGERFRIEALVGNTLVAYLEYSGPDGHGSPVVIQGFEVNDEYRSRGIGSALTAHLREICSTRYDSCPIQVYIAPLDSYVRLETLEAFYRRNGAALKECRDANNLLF
ncbi:MAG: GNAT family N-acetyltransferase [Deltaproteobacteria bacterium]